MPNYSIAVPPPDPKNLANELSTQTPEEQRFIQALNSMGVTYNYSKRAYSLAQESGPPLNLPTQKLVDRLLMRTDGMPAEQRLRTFLRLWSDQEEIRIVKEKREQLRGVDPAGNTELRKLVNLVCREGADFSFVILRQWLWQVRRKLDGVQPVGHIMPVLQGTQGCGKSTTIEALIAPLSPLTGKWDFPQITDERHWVDLERCYVGYVEECADANKASLGILKGILTTATKQVRLLNTHDRTTIVVNTSFIGDTNFRLNDIIRDTSGGRRFWEIRCRKEIDLDAVKALDFLKIWRCVDPKESSPLLGSEFFREIKQLQASKLRAPSSVDAWLAEVCHLPGEEPKLLAELFVEYRGFCRTSGELPLTKARLGRELAQRGYEKRTARPAKGKSPGVCVLLKK